MSGVRVYPENTESNPQCPHGPSLLFSRIEDEKPRRFYACSACRDRKDCNFFVWEDQLEKSGASTKAITTKINHINLFRTVNDVKQQPESERMYCLSCDSLQLPKYKAKHTAHVVTEGISDRMLSFPSELLKPLENSKKEAQYLFAQNSTDALINMMRELGFKNILCIGAPRIHEKIVNDCPDMSSLLLDFDKRFLNFFGPLEFCWYNLFNHHFFLKESKEVFEEFMTNYNPDQYALIMDPPFGGRLEPMAETLRKINSFYMHIHGITKDLPVFLILPYFMEPQINNSLEGYDMVDYKVDYVNHPLFTSAENDGRKFGSPVRVFTNVKLSLIKLPESEGYKYCKRCDKYVSSENRHCKLCKNCTSKDGRRYKHCKVCDRCVKPTWQHCKKCNRCAQSNHTCGDILFQGECFICNEAGHKKGDCPKVTGVSEAKTEKTLVTGETSTKRKKHVVSPKRAKKVKK